MLTAGEQTVCPGVGRIESGLALGYVGSLELGIPLFFGNRFLSIWRSLFFLRTDQQRQTRSLGQQASGNQGFYFFKHEQIIIRMIRITLELLFLRVLPCLPTPTWQAPA